VYGLGAHVSPIPSRNLELTWRCGDIKKSQVVSIMLLASVGPHVRLVNVSHCGLIWYMTWHMCSCCGTNRNMGPVGNETFETMVRVIGASWSRVGGVSGLLDFRRHDRVVLAR
jgi:hypothetical protein